MRFSSTTSVFALGALFLNASAIPLQQGDSLGAAEASVARGITTSKVDEIPNDKRGITTSKVDFKPNDKRDIITPKIDFVPIGTRGVTTSKIEVIPSDKRGIETTKFEFVPFDKPSRVRVRSGRARSNTKTGPR